jgi:uncharacterized protein YkwD
LRYALALLGVALITVAASAALLESRDARAAGSYNGYVKACNGKKVYLRPAEKQTLALHNRVRIRNDRPRLCIQQQLLRAARKHSADMMRKDYFSHRSRDGSTLSQRVRREGYTPRGMSVYRIGENIGWGSGSLGSPRKIHRAWMRSDGHRKNIMNRGFRQVGIGVIRGKYKSYDNARMYTVNFGYRRR